MSRRNPKSKVGDHDREVCAAVWTSPHGQKLMEALAYDIGPRPCGSKAMRRASNLLMKAFRGLGARHVHTEPVPVLAWHEGPSSLELVAPHRRKYESLQHVHTTAGTVTARLVDAGSGSDQELDLLGKRIDGAVVLLRGPAIAGSIFTPLETRIQRVCDRGAAGVILPRTGPGRYPAIELAGILRDIPIPVLGVSAEDGQELGTYAKTGRARVRLEATGRSYRATCVNTVAELGSTRLSADIIVLGAHVDSFHVGPGAFDNLTGVVTLVEIARALAPLQSSFKRCLRLVVYTGEEYGFLGSRSYVERHKQELDRTRFVFNLDSLGSATAEGVAVMWSPAMRDYIGRCFEQTSRRVDVRNLFCMSSDYLPFMLAGIAAARPAGFESPYLPWYHTREDTPDKVHPDWIRLNGMTYAQLLLRMLMDPQPLPSRRRSAEETKALIAKEDAALVLRPYGFDV
jgi:Zn-dependent M28 family amino/carboxypeptidase